MLFLNLRINYFKLFFDKLKDDQSFATFKESFTLCYYAQQTLNVFVEESERSFFMILFLC